MKRRCPAFLITDAGYVLDGKYQATTLLKGHNISTAYCALIPNGQLVIKKGFVWDGPSGPAIDTANTLIPSAIHDCLYLLISEGLLPTECRNPADKTYRESLKNWGNPRWRRFMHYKGVDWFGWMHV